MSTFQHIGSIRYEGTQTDNPLAFRYYNPNELVLGQRMEDYLRFACAYWHTFVGEGADPFGVGTAIRPWRGASGIDLAKRRVEASFEFYEKLGIPYFCFHDRDIAPEGATLRETNQILDVIVNMIKEYMKTSKV